MKKKKTGSVAIPFLITFLISLVLIGGTAMVIYDKIDSDESSLIPMVNEVGTLSSEDDHTIMFVLDMSDTVSNDGESEETDEEDYSEEDEYYDEYDEWEYDDLEYDEDDTKEKYSYQPYTFIIMRSQPVDKKITFLGIPSNMQIGEENREAEDIYIDNGVSALKGGIEYTLGIEIDRYMVLNTESFTKICNILGGVSFAVPKGVDGVAASKDEQYLSAEQIGAIISCGNYAGGELQRISTASSIVTAMLNQTRGERIAGNLDNSVNAILNMTETDISASDYNNRKYAIKFMLEYSDPGESETRSTRAQFITPYGTTEGKSFVADKYFSEDIKSCFDESEKKPEEASEKKTEADSKSEDSKNNADE